MVTFEGKTLIIEGKRHLLDYLISDLCEFKNHIVVLFDPDEGLNISGQFNNLASFSYDGNKRWVADSPTSSGVHAYYKIASKNPLIGYSMASYRCQIDPCTGAILESEFYK